MAIGIEELTFTRGPDGSTPLSVTPTPVVVLVGPNNSGKSLALREVEAFCSMSDPKTRVVSDVKLTYPHSMDEVLELLAKFKTDPPPGEVIQKGDMYLNYYTPGGKKSSNVMLRTKDVESYVQNKIKDFMASHIIKWYTIRLDGRTRLSLTDNHATSNLQGAPTSHLMALFMDDSKRKKMRDLTKDALDHYFTIDPTGMTEFGIRLSRRLPKDSSEERGLDAASIKFHAEAPHISEFSDGVNAYVGLIAAVMSLEHKIMMIDEPEAFLHPTLARVLAKNLAEIAKERGATLLVSTHSSSFLLGATDSSADVTLIRLTYDGEAATTRILESEQVSHMAKSPLLKATRVLDALFSKAAVVVEGDTDRAFYEAVNDNLNRDGHGIDQCLFINAQNKQTLYKIVGPLRKMGIPTAAVADFDIVNLRKAEWKSLMSSLGAPDAALLHPVCTKIVGELNDLKTGDDDPIHRQGCGALVENKAVASDLLSKLRRHGLFVVECGALETWLPDVPRKKWIEDALELLDTDPQSSALDGARTFLGNMREWIDDAKGGVA